jgi:hypothetical protein
MYICKPKSEGYTFALVQVAKSAPYNLDANLAILWHYKFQPQSAKIDVLAKILILALSQLPGSDYRTCIRLVPGGLQVRSSMSQIAHFQPSGNTALVITGTC